MFYYYFFQISNLTVLYQIVNTCLACVWTYTDLFIILIAFYIGERFHRIIKHLKKLRKNNVVSVEEWRSLRQNYNNLSKLCHNINEFLSNLILSAFFTNIYFIVTGLFYGLRMKIRSVVQFLGFMAGFALMCMRSACVCWFGGKVSEETEELLQHITSLPPSFYNVEVITLH